jgi:pSer/pThr/pTyr-binding forkhead associated (FHA) protein
MRVADVDLRHGISGKNADARDTESVREPAGIMLDCGRVNALRLQFPEREPADLALEPGVHPVGRRIDGSPGPVARSEAAVQFCIDQRGAWLQVREGVRGVHVNGRPVRHMALLRAGDVVFVEGFELLLVTDAPAAPPSGGEPPGEADARIVLRSLGGSNHGRCFALDAPCVIGRARDCAIRIDGADVAEHHARLEPRAGGIILQGLDSMDGSVVNGHRMRDAWMQPGDQLVVGTHRFVIESSSPAASRQHADVPAVQHEVEAATPSTGPRREGLRRMPWLLLAALLLSAALSLLLLYGVR